MIVRRIDIIARGHHLKFTGRFTFTDLVAGRRAVRFGLPVVVFFDNELDDLWAAIVGTGRVSEAMSEAGQALAQGIADGFTDCMV